MMSEKTPAADIVERLRTRAAKIKGYITSSQIVVDLLAPQMKLFNDRSGHDIYTVRMSVDHQSSIRTQTKELSDLEEAATEIEALRAREAELQTALEEADRKNDALSTEWNDALRKLDVAVKALEWIRLGDTEVFDDDLECLVTVSADSEELSTAADKALASIRGEG